METTKSLLIFFLFLVSSPLFGIENCFLRSYIEKNNIPIREVSFTIPQTGATVSRILPVAPSDPRLKELLQFSEENRIVFIKDQGPAMVSGNTTYLTVSSEALKSEAALADHIGKALKDYVDAPLNVEKLPLQSQKLVQKMKENFRTKFINENENFGVSHVHENKIGIKLRHPDNLRVNAVVNHEITHNTTDRKLFESFNPKQGHVSQGLTPELSGRAIKFRSKPSQSMDLPREIDGYSKYMSSDEVEATMREMAQAKHDGLTVDTGMKEVAAFMETQKQKIQSLLKNNGENLEVTSGQILDELKAGRRQQRIVTTKDANFYLEVFVPKGLSSQEEKAFVISVLEKRIKTFDAYLTNIEKKRSSSFVAAEMAQQEEYLNAVSASSAPLKNEMAVAYKKGREFLEIERELLKLKNTEPTSKADIIKKAVQPEILTNSKKILEKEIKEINDKFIHSLHEMYKTEGIPSKIISMNGHPALQLDFSQKPSSARAFEFYKKASKRFGVDKVTVSLADTSSRGALGFFSSSNKRMEIGPGQGLMLLDNFVNSTGKHELRHSMFLAKRNRGAESVFNTQFYASTDKKNLLNNSKKYDSYMSAEELYTFSTDLQSFSQLLKGENVLNEKKRLEILTKISGKNESLHIIGQTQKEVVDSMLESIEKIKQGEGTNLYSIVQEKDGKILMTINDKLGRRTVLSFVSDKEKAPLKQTLENSTDASGSLDEARKKLENLKRLAEIQMEESKVTKKLLETYMDPSTGGQDVQLQDLRAQLFKTAKNVKEDYKGFALNQEVKTLGPELPNE